MSIDQARVDAINELVVGWMQPVFRRDDLFGGEPLNGLGPADFARVKAGYGCPRCLAKFKTYLVTCPACLYQRDVMADVEAPPQDWVDHLKAREEHTAGKPLSADEFLAEVARDRSIEQRRLNR